MNLRMWTYDLAREQAPTLGHLRDLCKLSLDSGYNAFGLYLEHRFGYPSTPWAHGIGAVQPETISALQIEFPDLQIVPFVNLLGHFEGMLYTEYGKRFREAQFSGLQACACNPEFVDLCRALLRDVLQVFDSKLIHIGGDETAQLGQCDLCKSKVQEYERNGATDGKAKLYGDHFGPLAQWVVDQGRTPGVWGDMFVEHPSALDSLPKETVVFDWQYFNGVAQTASLFVEKGFVTVGCPAIHTYNALWAHVDASERNVRDVVADANAMKLEGVCLTTWECGLFGSYGSIKPMIQGAGRLMSGVETTFLDEFTSESVDHRRWANLMSVELAALGGSFTPGKIRSSIKVRLLLNANPFLAWLHHANEYCGEIGEKALQIFENAISVAPNATYRGIAEFGKFAVEFVRLAEKSRLAYSDHRPGDAISALAPTRQIFEQLERIAKANHLNEGGSLADVERCRVAREHIERVIKRIRDYGDGSLGYLPAFEHLTHPKFVPHDQAAWWLINKWANE